jgi:hypothetical protein
MISSWYYTSYWIITFSWNLWNQLQMKIYWLAMILDFQLVLYDID